MNKYAVVERGNHLAVHAYFEDLKSAEQWIKVNAVEYCAKGYFMDKSLTPNSFVIINNPIKSKK